MKRRILNFYRHQVPVLVKRAIPDAVMAYVSGVAYRIIPHPDLAFYHARYLSRNGHGQKAAHIYGGDSAGSLIDPLFECHAKSAKSDAANLSITSGNFIVEFSYAGIKVVGKLPANPDADLDRIDIFLDDQLLRSESLTFKNNSASFHFSIKREALRMFSPNSVLNLRTPSGDYITSDDFGTHVALSIPHGTGEMANHLTLTGTLDKKGNTRPSKRDVDARQNGYLALYERATQVFEDEFGIPLILLCGTLLGQHRDGGFVPGDDDFDVGYVSEKTTPEAVKAEAIDIIQRLTGRGFLIAMNREGKPFRISDAKSGIEIHLDVTPVYCPDDGHVWMHKLARLDISLDELRQTETDDFNGVLITKPKGTEAYLAAYYGPTWNVPDPNFAYADWAAPQNVVNGLRATCLNLEEQQALMATTKKSGQGAFLPLSLQPLYPLKAYEAKAGV